VDASNNPFPGEVANTIAYGPNHYMGHFMAVEVIPSTGAYTDNDVIFNIVLTSVQSVDPTPITQNVQFQRLNKITA